MRLTIAARCFELSSTLCQRLIDSSATEHHSHTCLILASALRLDANAALSSEHEDTLSCNSQKNLAEALLDIERAQYYLRKSSGPQHHRDAGMWKIALVIHFTALLRVAHRDAEKFIDGHLEALQGLSPTELVHFSTVSLQETHGTTALALRFLNLALQACNYTIYRCNYFELLL